MRARVITVLAWLAAGQAAAATMEEADALFAAKNWADAAAAYESIVEMEPGNSRALVRLARSRAAAGDSTGALSALERWFATGNGSYRVAMAVPELRSLHDDPRFVALVKPFVPCNGPEFRQFDFWLGEWDVESAASPGTVSRSTIASVNGGCTIREQYTTPAGYEGTSLNFYDAARKVWHQTWIDNGGAPLYLEGRLQGAAMVLATSSDPQSVNRITWTPLEDGSVRQHWESTTDGGRTWSTVFDGYYTRRKSD